MYHNKQLTREMAHQKKTIINQHQNILTKRKQNQLKKQLKRNQMKILLKKIKRKSLNKKDIILHVLMVIKYGQ